PRADTWVGAYTPARQERTRVSAPTDTCTGPYTPDRRPCGGPACDQLSRRPSRSLATASDSSRAGTGAGPRFITTRPPWWLARRAFVERRAGGERERDGGHHRVASAGDVGHRRRSESGNVRRRPLRLEERHAAAAARDEHRLHAGPPQQRPARPLERAGVVAD